MNTRTYRIELTNDAWGRYTFFAQGDNHTEALRNALREARRERPGGHWDVMSLQYIDGYVALAAKENR